MTTMTESNIIAVGTSAPNFTLPDKDGNEVSLKDFSGRWLVLFFYPQDNTPECTIEAKEFSAHSDQFEKLGATLIGISPNSVKSHYDFHRTQELKITLLADPDKNVIRKYGALRDKKKSGTEHDHLVRSTFVISPDGKLAHSWIGVSVEGHVKAVLTALEALVLAEKGS